MSDEGVLRSLDAIMHGERSRIVQAKARVDVISEMTVKGVQVLFQIHVKEGQSPSVVVQRHAYPDRVHRDPQVRAPAVVQKLIFMPVKTEKHLKSTEWRRQRSSKYKAWFLSSCLGSFSHRQLL